GAPDRANDALDAVADFLLFDELDEPLLLELLSGGSRPLAAPRRAGARCRPRTAARRASRGCASGMVEAARRRQPWAQSAPAHPIRVLFRDFAPEDFTIELTNAVSISSRNENRRELLLPFQEKT